MLQVTVLYRWECLVDRVRYWLRKLPKLLLQLLVKPTICRVVFRLESLNYILLWLSFHAIFISHLCIQFEYELWNGSYEYLSGQDDHLANNYLIITFLSITQTNDDIMFCIGSCYIFNREEKKLADLTDQPPIPDFKSRTNRDLMRIVEDQVSYSSYPLVLGI